MKITLDQVVLKITVEDILVLLIAGISSGLLTGLSGLEVISSGKVIWTNFFIVWGINIVLIIFIRIVIFCCCKKSNYEKKSEKCKMREEKGTVLVVHVEGQEYYPIGEFRMV